jgi:alpha-N-arabinofuranosidase
VSDNANEQGIEGETEPMSSKALWQHTISGNPGQAKVTLDTGTQSAYRISPLLRGKFCEHLGANIYGGMEAQILVNPTFGHWPFNAGDFGSDGGMRPESDLGRQRERAAQFARQQGFPDPDSWPDDFLDGGAFGWRRVGTKTDVSLSPDVGPHGGRAQRVEVTGTGGIQQWTYLPLHRTRRFEFRLIARSATPVDVTLALASANDGGKAKALASLSLSLTNTWTTHEGVLEVPADAVLDDAGLFLLNLTVAESANIVIGRLLLYPDDHIHHADPDVIQRLRESHLPLLRWPGGNFESGYDWRDGIGPVDTPPHPP